MIVSALRENGRAYDSARLAPHQQELQDANMRFRAFGSYPIVGPVKR